MKLWEKNVKVNKDVEAYTVGRDKELDVYLAPYDVLGSMAHIQMLESIGLLAEDELTALLKELKEIYRSAVDGTFTIEEGIEDVHSQVELLLTRKLGDVGKKIHSGRSRNGNGNYHITCARCRSFCQSQRKVRYCRRKVCCCNGRCICAVDERKLNFCIAYLLSYFEIG